MLCYQNKPLWMRIILVMIVVIIFALAYIVPPAYAVAVLAPVVVKGAEVILAALIVAGGAKMRNEVDLMTVASSLREHIFSTAKLSAVKDWLIGSVNLNIRAIPGVSSGLRVTDFVWHAINDYLSVKGATPGVIDADWTSYTGVLTGVTKNDYVNPGNVRFASLSSSTFGLKLSALRLNGVLYTAGYSGKDIYLYADGVVIAAGVYGAKYSAPHASRVFFSYSNDSSAFLSVGATFYSESDYTGIDFGLVHTLTRDFPLHVDFSMPAGVAYSGTIGIPADDTLVKVPPMPRALDDGDDIVMPDLSLNPADYQVKGAELPIPIADIPTDTPIDLSTGKAITADGTDVPDIPDSGNGILGWLKGFWDALKALLQSLLDAIKSWFDSPSDFRLDFDGFKNLILYDRFPFSIPFDLKRSVEVFAANAQDYQLSIDLETSFFSIHEKVDLRPFVVAIGFFRYGAVIWFTISLILKTRDLIKW